MIQRDMSTLLMSCVAAGNKRQGGVSTTNYGLVFTVVNPTMLNVANTCMAAQGPQRKDIVQCVLEIAAEAPQAANVPGPQLNLHGPQPNLPGPQLNLPGPAAASIPDSLLVDWIPDLPAIGPSDAGPSGAGPSGAGPADGDADPAAVALERAGSSTGTTPAGADPAGTGPGGTGPIGVGPAGAGPSNVECPPAFQGRMLPPPPLASEETRQIAYVGMKHSPVSGTWVLQDTDWVSGRKNCKWKTCGSWYLVLGLGPPSPFPVGAIPAWAGAQVWIRAAPKTSHPTQTLSEAWIAVDGKWTPLQGLVPPHGTWMREGGWVLLRGG
ncbi:hypothetical protein MMC11_001899 [Xylographa trunciseda]|nr:hypothetical protein [Xylographa trunciseda]